MDFVTCFISLLYLSAIVSLSMSENCTYLNTCSCKTSTYTIDLSPLKSGGNPRFSVPGGDYQYDYEPCVALSDKCDKQDGVAICQKSETAQFNAGTVVSAVFFGDADAGNLKLTYSTDIRASSISLQCSCDEGIFSFIRDENVGEITNYYFVLKTRHACGTKKPNCSPDKGHGISTGSVLLILFFVFLAVYFIAGFLFLKFARGAQGTELVPNYEFWTALPGLIKEGIQFTCRGCKTDASYSQI